MAATTLRRYGGLLRLAGILGPLLLVLAVSAACLPGAQWHPGETGESGGPPGEAPASQLVVAPAADAKNVAPADPVTVELVNGSLESVGLAGPAGQVIAGEFGPDRRTWHNTGKLGYNKAYTLSVAGTGSDGKHYQESRRFTTAKPNEYTLPYLRANVATLLNGGTFGVGQPIVVWFDEPIPDRAAAQRALSVTTDPPVVGTWRWMDDHEVHWRPMDYWPAHTKVTVVADVYGRNLGGGLYGDVRTIDPNVVTASFTIGASKIAIADYKTYHMKVYIDGVQVTKINGKDVTAGIPVSMGKPSGEVGANGEWVDFRTSSGPHVVLAKQESYRMTSTSFGITNPSSPNYYDVVIKKTVRITSGGEFVHLADWNIPKQGYANTSHGCINVAPTYIYWFYDTFGIGDIVDVRNSGLPMKLRDGLGDWTMSWQDWIKDSTTS